MLSIKTKTIILKNKKCMVQGMDYQKNKMTSADNGILHKLYYYVYWVKKKYFYPIALCSQQLYFMTYMRICTVMYMKYHPKGNH